MPNENCDRGFRFSTLKRSLVEARTATAACDEIDELDMETDAEASEKPLVLAEEENERNDEAGDGGDCGCDCAFQKCSSDA